MAVDEVESPTGMQNPTMENGLERDSTESSATNASWFTPKRLLLIFCIINLLNFMDRGSVASNGVNGSRGTCSASGTCSSGTGIQGDFNLTNFEDGALASAYMVGLLTASPIFASLAKSINPFRIIGVGLSVWMFAVIGCGLSFDFLSITVCRMLVGVGEASFVSFAAPFIDDNAPIDKKTAWLAIFYMCVPTGFALGYVYGGLVGGSLHWRFAFWGEAILMLPFVVLGFITKPLQLKGFASADSKKVPSFEEENISDVQDETVLRGGVTISLVNSDLPDKSSCETLKSRSAQVGSEFSIIMNDMKGILMDKIYVANVLGNVAYTFVLGAYSYWGPKAGYNIYNMSNADIIFGGITIFCGILGTLAGGYILDFMGSTISNAFKLLSVVTFVGAIFCFTSFCFKNMYAFLALFAIGELLIVSTMAPVNYINLRCVKPSLRPLSMALSTVSIHIFGDVPSSPLFGILQDKIHNWRVTSLVLTSVLFPAAAIWFIGVFLKSVDRSNEDGMYEGAEASKPLLQTEDSGTTYP